MTEEIRALKIVRSELNKIYSKYFPKAEKERTKIEHVYVTVQGEKCYTEEEINDWYSCDYISCSQADKYIEKLEAKQKKAGLVGASLTKSEMVCKIVENMITNTSIEIKDLTIKEEEKIKKQERWEIAKAQGMNYTQFLELEEISRQSEEYERMMKSD